MTPDPATIRIEGIYQQRQEGFFMQRVKLPAGVLSALQARSVGAIAERFGRGTIHLTSRGSMEVHWLKGEDLPSVKREMGKAGLTSRGACGGAVRGITCSSQGADSFPGLESLARQLHRHFTGNPRFEGLPKKFKIGIEADRTGGRHLIQDVGIVFAGSAGDAALYEVWIAGGLGREPRPGYLLEQGVREERLIPLIEAVVRVYARLAPPPKRLKFLAAQMGEEELSRLIRAEAVYGEELPVRGGLGENLTVEGGQRLLLPVFAGQLTAASLLELAAFAEENSAGVMQVTADQDLAFPLAAGVDPARAAAVLTGLASRISPAEAAIAFRVCPGSHECRMGLAATREVAQELLAELGTTARGRVWALSGCPNSCTQPQLAEIGISAVRLTAGDDGVRTPRFDLYCRDAAGLGKKVAELLTFDELRQQAGRLAEGGAAQ